MTDETPHDPQPASGTADRTPSDRRVANRRSSDRRLSVLILLEANHQQHLLECLRESNLAVDSEVIGDFEQALPYLAGHSPDLLVISWSLWASRRMTDFGRLKSAARQTAVLALLPEESESVETVALSAGAQECLALNRLDACSFKSSALKAIERARYDRKLRNEIVSLRAYNQSLDKLAQVDPLTGLANRQRFVEQVNAAICLAQREVRMMALLYLDIDGFKRLNDQYGHDVGDEALRWFAGQLRDGLDLSEVIGRMGGDEFVMLLDNVRNPNDVANVAHRIVDLLQRPVDLAGYQVQLSTSIGIAMFPRSTTSEQLIRHADIAMYHAKQRQDGEHVRFFDRSLEEKLNAERALAELLDASIDQGDISVAYQPIYDYRHDRVRSAEVLFRWPHTDAYSTEEIIRLAESTHTIRQIDHFALATAVSEVRDRDVAGLHSLSVNASVLTLDQAYLRLLIQSMTGPNRLPFKLCVELTETAVSSSFREMQKWVQHLRKQNVAVALDDFGTGYASLKYVQQLDVDVLKIDMELVRDVESDASARAICEAAIAMAHTLGTRVTAEGVSNIDQFETLRELGCDCAQGYYIARPGSADALVTQLVA